MKLIKEMQVTPSRQDNVTSKVCYIFLSISAMIIIFGQNNHEVTQLLLIKLLDPLVTLSCKVTWQAKTNNLHCHNASIPILIPHIPFILTLIPHIPMIPLIPFPDSLSGFYK